MQTKACIDTYEWSLPVHTAGIYNYTLGLYKSSVVYFDGEQQKVHTGSLFALCYYYFFMLTLLYLFKSVIVVTAPHCCFLLDHFS